MEDLDSSSTKVKVQHTSLYATECSKGNWNETYQVLYITTPEYSSLKEKV